MELKNNQPLKKGIIQLIDSEQLTSRKAVYNCTYNGEKTVLISENEKHITGLNRLMNHPTPTTTTTTTPTTTTTTTTHNQSTSPNWKIGYRFIPYWGYYTIKGKLK